MSERAHSRAAARAVQDVPLAELREHPDNPRRITRARLDQLKRNLAADPAMLQARPIIALPDGRVVAGNMRLRAARELGWASLPVFRVELDAETARLWMLRDNNAFGEWDTATLAEMLAELDALDLELTGFDEAELARLLPKPPRDADAVPPVPATPRSQRGVAYELGPHRLMCADARDADAVCDLVGGGIDVLWTDPPYGVGYVGKTADQLTIRNDEGAGLRALLDAVFAAVDPVLEAGCRVYCAAPAGPRELDFRLAFDHVGWRLAQTLVWVKDVFVLGHSDYHYQHEPILYGHKPGEGRVGRGRHDGSRWYGGHDQPSVFQIARPTRSSDHPTMKPVELVAACLANSSQPGDAVLDPFAGSGSTLIAADQLGRRCFAMEIDPVYCDVIRDRWEAWTAGGRVVNEVAP